MTPISKKLDSLTRLKDHIVTTIPNPLIKETIAPHITHRIMGIKINIKKELHPLIVA